MPAQPAAVAQLHDCSCSWAEHPPRTRYEACTLHATLEQRHGDAPAKWNGHVAPVCNRDEQRPRAGAAADVQAAEGQTANDATGQVHLDADTKPRLDVDAVAADRPRRQQNEQRMLAGLCVSRSSRPQRENGIRPWTQRQARRGDPQPLLRRRLPAECAPRGVDDHGFGAVVSKCDLPRARRREHELRGRDGERDARRVGTRPFRRKDGDQHECGHARDGRRASQRATAVNVTVAV